MPSVEAAARVPRGHFGRKVKDAVHSLFADLTSTPGMYLLHVAKVNAIAGLHAPADRMTGNGQHLQVRLPRQSADQVPTNKPASSRH